MGRGFMGMKWLAPLLKMCFQNRRKGPCSLGIRRILRHENSKKEPSKKGQISSGWSFSPKMYNQTKPDALRVSPFASLPIWLDLRSPAIRSFSGRSLGSERRRKSLRGSEYASERAVSGRCGCVVTELFTPGQTSSL